MGNTQTLLPLDQADKDVVSVSDSTLISTAGSNAAEIVDNGQNETAAQNGHASGGTKYRISDTIQRESPTKRVTSLDFRDMDRNYGVVRETNITSPYKYDCHGSPLPFSDNSTDGESGVSETYKNLLKRDYLTMRNGCSFSANSTPSRVVKPHVTTNNDDNDVPYTCAMDVNLDYTIHVGKLAIYIKQIRFNVNRIEEVVVDGHRIRGKIKCCLLNPTKGQKNTSNVFEAKRRNKSVVYRDLEECFVFYLFPKSDISLMSLLFKVTVSKKLFREFSLGESTIRLGDLDLNAEMLPMTITFGDETLSERCTRSLQSVVLPKSEKLEILLSLEYNINKKKLIVNVDQTTKLDELRYESKREIIFQAELVSPSCECVQRKTTFLRISEDNPGSNKPFEFDLPQEDLLINTLMLSVSYSATRWLQQEKIGWIALGRNCSGRVESEHWDLMISQSLLHQSAVQWHCLCDRPDGNKSHTLLTRVFK